LRWGNFDFATSQSQWKSSELPSGLTVPTSQALPPSLFLTSRPAWWGTTPWPAIGPDVSGGPDGAGHAHKIPAQVCYEGTRKNGDGTLAFNAKTCYAETAPLLAGPSAPSNLSVR